MKFFQEESVIADTAIFLFVFFGCLIYLSPWFAFPSVAILAAWVVDRLKAKADLVEAKREIDLAKHQLTAAIQERGDLKDTLANLQAQINNLKSAHAMRGGK